MKIKTIVSNATTACLLAGMSLYPMARAKAAQDCYLEYTLTCATTNPQGQGTSGCVRGVGNSGCLTGTLVPPDLDACTFMGLCTQTTTTASHMVHEGGKDAITYTSRCDFPCEYWSMGQKISASCRTVSSQNPCDDMKYGVPTGHDCYPGS